MMRTVLGLAAGLCAGFGAALVITRSGDIFFSVLAYGLVGICLAIAGGALAHEALRRREQGREPGGR